MNRKISVHEGNGYWGKICCVDLGAGTVCFEDVPEDLYRRFLGGAGLALRILWDRIQPGIAPLEPGNVLAFAPGLLTDTGSLFTGRFTVLAKSPASGGLGDANCGGYFSPFLKRCGIDGLFVNGKAEAPVYVLMQSNRAEIRDASDLWGKDTIDTEQELKRRHGQSAQVACIGPAGERLSHIAGISTDGGRIAARSGMGCVMGSKMLKAVVAIGSARVGIADRKRVKQLTEEFRNRLKSFGFIRHGLNDRILALAGRATGKRIYMRQPAVVWRWMLKKYGTPALTVMSAESGDSPIKNWEGNVAEDFPAERYWKIRGERVVEYETKKYGCYSCPIRCGGTVSIPDGPYPIEKMHKPEYETICAFGDLLLNDDLHAIFKLNDMVNRAGMDSISCGGVLAFAIECYENGILDSGDTDGLDLRWGNAAALVELTRMIVNREGLGNLLADGVKKAAERIGKGSERFAVHCGGIEPPMHDARFDPGLGIAYACEATPGRHTLSCFQFLDIQSLEKQFSRAKTPPFVYTHRGKHRYENRGEEIAVGCFYKMLVDAAGACLFGTQVGADLPLCPWMNAATGRDLSNDDYLTIGERIEHLRHAFNLREGINSMRDFRPHPRLYGSPPLESGPVRGVTLDLDALARSFYDTMGWDLSTGRPSVDRLRDLGLTEVIEALYPEETPHTNSRSKK